MDILPRFSDSRFDRETKTIEEEARGMVGSRESREIWTGFFFFFECAAKRRQIRLNAECDRA